MNFLSFTARFFSVLALLGMLLLPVSTAAAGNVMAATEAAAVLAMARMDDVDCCPNQKPVKADCGLDCPLVVVCTASTAMTLSRADWSPIELP